MKGKYILSLFVNKYISYHQYSIYNGMRFPVYRVYIYIYIYTHTYVWVCVFYAAFVTIKNGLEEAATNERLMQEKFKNFLGLVQK